MKTILISLFSLMVLDAASTYWGLTTGRVEEGNPVLRYLMHNHLEITILLFLIISGVLIYKLWQHRHKTKHIKGFVIGLLIVKALVVANNIFWLSRTF